MGVSYLLLCFNLFLLVSFIGDAKINAADKSKSGDKVYIVYMGKTHVDDAPRNDHAQLLDELKKRKNADFVLHTYNKSFLGFAARLSDEEAESIARRDGVVSVFPDEVSQLHTTHSWDFLMTQTPNFIFNGSTIPLSVSNWQPSGADTIIGFLDSGIWVDHPSFNEMYMGPIPERWKGTCMPDKNSSYPPFKCNRKVIGARYYDTPENRITTASDYHGHGTMSTSIAAGKPVSGASYKGLDMGTARGGSPSSRIAMYRVCGADYDCMNSAILKGFDDAISDGVDLISLSLGYNHTDLLADPLAIGAFHAMEKGILVLSAAGNSGPSPGTIENFAPWILTVAATTIDREFETVVLLGGNKQIKSTGSNMDFSGLNKSPIYPLLDGSKCIPGSLDGAKVKGKIVLCEHINDTTSFSDIYYGLFDHGAIGIIMIEDVIRKGLIDFGTYPFASITEVDGVQIRSYINSTRNPLATILPTVTVLNRKPAPVVQHSSSRGPAPSIKNLIKPDVAAPGVNILAAWPLNGDTEPHLFDIWHGTSIACAHVSGLAATVKSQHPTWSPSFIRSAIMTTAIRTNNLHDWITTYMGSRATPYDIGAGEINLFGPLCPGLIYETKKADYIQFLCNMGYNSSTIKSISLTVPSNFYCPSNSSPDLISDINYPSIAISGLEGNGRRTVTRTVTNVGEVYSTYTATLEAPAGIQVQVVPNVLRFTKTVTKLSFEVTFVIRTTASQEPLFGSITWSNGRNIVRSPFAVTNA